MEIATSLPAGTRVLVLASGKAGHEANAFGIAAALNGETQIKTVSPRRLWRLLAPWGAVDPADAVRAPWPDVAIACGRLTIPYLRAIKQWSRGDVFTIALQDPRAWRGTFDLIWTPQHDFLRGRNVLTTLTSPHPLRPAVLEEARRKPDPRIALLERPRLAMILGRPSAGFTFEATDRDAGLAIAPQVIEEGRSVMVTPSRRTPPAITQALDEALAAFGPKRAFVWTGRGENPYRQMMADADALLVTGDSVNMVGEATVTGAPVLVYQPTGRAPKVARFLDALEAAGAVRRWRGAFETWTYRPLDATDEIAAEIVRRHAAFRETRGRGTTPRAD